MTHPENIVHRYVAVYNLWNGTTNPGEKANAHSAMLKMQEKFPGIHAQAFPPKAGPTPQPQGQGQQSAPRSDGSVPWYERFAGGFAGQQFRERAADAFDWAQRVAAEMASLEYARNAADELAEVQTKALQKERVQIAVKLPLRELYYLGSRFNDSQKQEFASRIATSVEEEILRLLSGGD